MYTVDADFPVDSIPPGTNLLVTGPPMTGKYDLLIRLLAEGFRHGDGAVVVTTKEGPDRVHAHVTDRAGVDSVAELGVVDCTGREGGRSGDDRIRYVSSPADLTGIGMASSGLIETFADRGLGVRTGLHSLSQLLMYADVKTVFRFLHILTGRISSANGLGVCTLDSEAHDDQTDHTVRQLFDGVIETRNGDGDRSFRLRGLGDADGEWTSF
ncbi:recombinase RecA [Halostella sp. JP-L12]|uniref:RAD55 family ATPase n=1 Tax=Halostella TaxID=1843185 RepID=UPI000EF84925|nr:MULTISPECIES: recombinase RecA [Halostella]NHN48537.1 recombinase RecA [Halostella sp. JP-L12]